MSFISQALKINPKNQAHQEWPLVKISQHKKKFLHEVINLAIKNILEECNTSQALQKKIEQTIYREKIRLQKKLWKVDTKNKILFWKQVESNFATIDNSNSNNEYYDILKKIITHYVYEIAGNFKPSYYRIAEKIVEYGFSRLLNASQLGGLRYFFSKKYQLKDKIKIIGEIKKLKKLAPIGTIVMVPTHFSHLDSALIGWVIKNLGLPPFIYGAGLNLFNIKIFAYFMNSLGVYKIDRRKKNLCYLTALKAYANLTLQKQCHSLFYPGGTRSRSGMIEKSLKLGLLSTTIEAQRSNYQKYGKDAPKIFIVPVVFNYHFVLEAPILIKQHLLLEGIEKKFQEQDKYPKSYKILKFLSKFFTQDSEMTISIGNPMDLFGNYVDDKGNSYTQDKRYINTYEYFISQGQIATDKQREDQYTRIISKAIIKEYYKINCVFTSHLVAFTAFQIIKQKHQSIDFKYLFSLANEDCIIQYKIFYAKVELIYQKIMALYQAKAIQISPIIAKNNITNIINHGLKHVGMYHAKRPLIKNKQGNITTQSLSTLYYYHNRLMGYELEKYLS